VLGAPKPLEHPQAGSSLQRSRSEKHHHNKAEHSQSRDGSGIVRESFAKMFHDFDPNWAIPSKKMERGRLFFAESLPPEVSLRL
jgi:hypothetical protein